VYAIDLGSSWCKAGLYNREGRLMADSRVDSRTGPLGLGATNGDLDHWWRAAAASVRALEKASYEGHHVDALAVSCRGFFGVFLDATMRSVVPAGLPQLPRNTSSCALAEWAPGGPWACAYAPIIVANARWLHEHMPDIHCRIRRAGALHNYILWRLTGRWVTDPASGPGGLPDWPPAAMDLSGLPRECFPDPAPAAAAVGSLTDDAASALGLSPGLTVGCGGHDGALANLGGGAWGVGDAMITLGTNVVLRVVTGQPVEGWFGYPIPPGVWAWVRGIPGVASRVEEDRAAGPKAYSAKLDEVAAAVKTLLDQARAAGLIPQRFTATGGLSRDRAMRTRLRQIVGRSITWADPEAGLRGAAMLAAVAAGWYPNVEAAVQAMRCRQ
jgi:sugar (pentulose or hexulose) kinase